MQVRKTNRATVSAKPISDDRVPTFPEWLPPTVTAEAERILNIGFLDEDEQQMYYFADRALVLRLATDERMQTVWPELSKHQQLRSWTLMRAGINKVDIGPPEDGSDALSLYFWSAYTGASLNLTAGTNSQYDPTIAGYEREAANLRGSAATLRRLRQDDWDQSNLDRYITQIEKAANICQGFAAYYGALRAAQAPLLIRRNQGNMQARGFVRLLAVETQNLFGKTLRGTLATVASVALMKDITDIQVRKWCKSLGA